MSDVLSSLVSALAGGGGTSQEDFDELAELVQMLHAHSLEAQVKIEDLFVYKADKAEVSTLARALNELWKAVKEMQDPEGASRSKQRCSSKFGQPTMYGC